MVIMIPGSTLMVITYTTQLSGDLVYVVQHIGWRLKINLHRVTPTLITIELCFEKTKKENGCVT